MYNFDKVSYQIASQRDIFLFPALLEAYEGSCYWGLNFIANLVG